MQTETDSQLSPQAVSRSSDRLVAVVPRVARLGRAVSRGVTLVEVLIVLAIMSMIAAGVVVAVIPRLNQARIDTATNTAREIRNAVTRWKMTSTDGCPTVSQLVQEKQIDSASKTDDPWGGAYKIACTEDDVIVTSNGPDKKDGTNDDISVPPKAANR